MSMDLTSARAQVVPLEGGRNFRDLGGYRAMDGREVRRGLLYRSGSLAGVTPAGVATLRGLGVVGLCDLRTSRERLAEPVDWHAAMGLSYWSRDYETSFGELRRLMESRLPDAEAAQAAMMEGYRRLPFEQAPAYRELFRRLRDGEVPLIFNCSAGKDRAGTAAALILTALGVPRETVLADFALTDRVGGLERMISRPATEGSLLANQSTEVIRAILAADPLYMATALDLVAPDAQAFEQYLEDVLEVDRASVEVIRERLLC